MQCLAAPPPQPRADESEVKTLVVNKFVGTLLIVVTGAVFGIIAKLLRAKSAKGKPGSNVLPDIPSDVPEEHHVGMKTTTVQPELKVDEIHALLQNNNALLQEVRSVLQSQKQQGSRTERNLPLLPSEHRVRPAPTHSRHASIGSDPSHVATNGGRMCLHTAYSRSYTSSPISAVSRSTSTQFGTSLWS